MENEEKIRLEARRRLEEQLKQYRVQRHKERVSEWSCYYVDSTTFYDFKCIQVSLQFAFKNQMFV